MRAKNAPPKSDKNEPDLVLLEPQIETIDLGVDSDSEKDSENSNGSNTESKGESEMTMAVASIKKEIEDDVEIDEMSGVEPKGGVGTNDDNVTSSAPAFRHPAVVEELEAAEAAIDDDEINENNDDVVPIEDNEDIHETDTKEAEDDVILHETNDVETIEDSALLNETNVNNDIQDETHDVNEICHDDEELKVSPEEINTGSSVGQIQEEIFYPQIMNVFGNVNVGAEVLAALPLAKSPHSANITNEIHEIDDAVGNNEDENVEEEIRRKAIEFTSDIVKVENPVNINDVESDDQVEETPLVIPEQDTPKVSDVTEALNKIQQEVLDTKTKAENARVTNPFIGMPTDLDFVDDGIELIDDGIEFEEGDDELPNKTNKSKSANSLSTKSDEEARSQSPKFDLKLLMQPIVYSVKLDDMKVFKNRGVDCLRDKSSIDSALTESKPEFLHSNNQKDAVSESSTHSENAQSDFGESEDDEYISEVKKVKLSSHLLQKPRSRSYNPIQLCKNPDFNTRLKRLTFGFLSSMRNRTFLKLLKPMTIDISKAFEGKLINGTMYLKTGDGSQLMCKENIEKPSEQASAVLPSAMPVQSLINNTPMNIGELLKPAIQPIPQDSMLTERQKTINLPDINHIRRINQQLLTAEVTPMVMNTNKCVKPPVQLIAPQNKVEAQMENEDKNKESDSKVSLQRELTDKPVVTRKPPGIIDAACKGILQKGYVVNKEAPCIEKEKQPDTESISNQEIAGPSVGSVKDPNTTRKTKQCYWISNYRVKPVKYSLPWNKPQYPAKTFEDSLLTIDTLQKMLNIICDFDNQVDLEKLTPKQRRRLVYKNIKKIDLQKRMEEYENCLKKLDKNKDKELESKTVDSKLKSKTKDQETKVNKNVPKVRVIQDKPYGEFCCWARIKLQNPGLAHRKQHKCPRVCKCCCRDELVSKITKPNQTTLKSTEIIISDDEDGKRINDTIENVVNQSKVAKQKPKNKKSTGSVRIVWPTSQDIRKIKTEVSIQCDLPPQETVPDIKSVQNLSILEGMLKERENQTMKSKSMTQGRTQTQEEVVTLDDADDITSATVTPINVLKSQSAHNTTPQNSIVNMTETVAPKLQGHIIIDGTKKLTVHNKPSTCLKTLTGYSKSKLLYLNQKNIQKQPTAPIYLGKNKILLTDIKFPRENSVADVPNATAVQQPQNVATTDAVVPPGVQLVLLPNGMLTYSVDSGIELDDAQKESLPTILAAVQEQLNATTLSTNNSGVGLSAPVNAVDDQGANKAGEPTSVVDITQETDEGTPTVNIENVPGPAVSKSDLKENVVNESTQPNISDLCINVENPDEMPNETGENRVCENIADEIVSEKPSKIISDETENLKTVNTGKEVENLTDIEHTIASEAPTETGNETENLTTVSTGKEVQNLTDMEQTQDDIDKGEPLVQNPEITAVVDKGNSSKTDVNKDIPQDVIAVEPTTEKVEERNEPSDITANPSRKSLLSDLMEMSGIWDDIDTNVPTANENVDQGPEVLSAVMPSEVLSAAADPTELLPQVLPTETLPEAVTPGTVPLPSLVPFNHPPLPIMNDRMPELTPITSFSQLKYACDRNGKFFKLDLNNGTLSSIKVCIKRQPTAISESVIDLTEEDDTSVEIRNESPKRIAPADCYTLPKHLRRSLLKASTVDYPNRASDSVKPIKLFRSVRILKRNKEHTVLLPAEADASGPPSKRYRKQKMIGLKDGDKSTEVLNEDSLDSSSLDQYIYRDSDFLDSSDGDTSDDEPLANKAKRMRKNEISKNTTNENVLDKNIGQNLMDSSTVEDQSELCESLEEAKQNDNNENLRQEETEEEYGEIEALDPDLEDNMMEFLPDNIEADDDDCILGV